MTLHPEETGKTFLSVSAGRIRQRANEDTPNAKKREVTNPRTNEKKIKWELVFSKITGQITGIFLKEDSEYGNQWIISMKHGVDEYQLQLGYESKYMRDLLEKALNIDFNNVVTLTPYSVPQKGGDTNVGMSIKQDEVKILSFFREYEPDPEHEGRMKFKKWINGIPVYDYDQEYNEDDYKIFKLTKIKFLKKVLVEKIVPKIQEANPIEHSTGALEPEGNTTDVVEPESQEDDLPF